MADVTIQVVTEDCKDEEVYSHDVSLVEGESLIAMLYDSVESVCRLYNSKGIKSIHLYFNGDDALP